MFDNYNRKITYLRVSVTDRCNLRCRYCMPACGIPLHQQKDILCFDEIVEVVRVASKLGIEKVRFTGGEPLVRRDLVKLVEMVAAVPGIRDLSMTTNGLFLGGMAGPLALAGLMRVNVSLDTMDTGKFKWLTRGGELSLVLKGIEAALKAGLTPLKINCVVEHSSDEPDAQAVARFAAGLNLSVRFIHVMDLKSGQFTLVEGGAGGDCENCNRLRLTADGQVKPCLFSEVSFDVRNMGAEKALRTAIMHKPACGTWNRQNHFYNIGG